MGQEAAAYTDHGILVAGMQDTKRIEEHEMTADEGSRPPFPPFTRETAAQKVRMAEDAWNTRDPERVSLAYTVDSTWRNRAEFLAGGGDRAVSPAEMGEGARLPPHQGAMGL